MERGNVMSDNNLMLRCAFFYSLLDKLEASIMLQIEIKICKCSVTIHDTMEIGHTLLCVWCMFFSYDSP